MDDESPSKPASDCARRASDADHQQIDREMNEAFGWNVMRNREIQITLERLRETHRNASAEERGRIIEAITARYRMFASKARSDGGRSVM